MYSQGSGFYKPFFLKRATQERDLKCTKWQTQDWVEPPRQPRQLSETSDMHILSAMCQNVLCNKHQQKSQSLHHETKKIKLDPLKIEIKHQHKNKAVQSQIQ